MSGFNASEYFSSLQDSKMDPTQEAKHTVHTGFPEPDTKDTRVVPLFASPLLITTLSQKFADSMQPVVANESQNQNENRDIHSGRNCYQSNPDLHIRHEQVRGLCNLIEKIMKDHFGFDLVIKDCWLNVNGPGGFNFEHRHDGIVSGVYYLQVPEDSPSDLVLHNPAIRADHLPTIENFHENYMHVTPNSNDLIMFPAWVTHRVEPNASQANRVSISFNAFLRG